MYFKVAQIYSMLTVTTTMLVNHTQIFIDDKIKVKTPILIIFNLAHPMFLCSMQNVNVENWLNRVMYHKLYTFLNYMDLYVV